MNRDKEFWVHPVSGNLITAKCMLSYCHLLEPAQVNNQGPYIHNAMLLIPADADISELVRVWQATCQRGMQEKIFPPGKLNPATGQMEAYYDMQNPIKEVAHNANMQEEFYRQFKYYITVRTYDGKAPGVVLPTGAETTDATEAYSGRWAVASVQAFPYNNRAYGVSLGVQNVQLLEHGDRLGDGKAKATTEFTMRSDVAIAETPVSHQAPLPAVAPQPTPAAQPQQQFVPPAAVTPSVQQAPEGVRVPQFAPPAAAQPQPAQSPGDELDDQIPDFGLPPAPRLQ